MIGDLPTPDPERIRARIERFASLTEPGDGVTRLAFTPLERRAHAVFTAEMVQLGLVVHTDPAGNTIAELPGTRPGAPALGVGSHLDSVPHGGRFDGITGVVAGMELATLLVGSGTRLEHPLRVVVFAGEEGARFGQACNGSRMAAGILPASDLTSLSDADGVSLAQAMTESGLQPEHFEQAAWNPADWRAFLELHIEQGAVLESTGAAVGVVTAISGSARLRITLTGLSTHSGGSPMELRHDALTAASELVLVAERLAKLPHYAGSRTTVGRMEVEPGSITTIPGHVTFTLDIRSVDPQALVNLKRDFLQEAEIVCRWRGVQVATEDLGTATPAQLPTAIQEQVAESCAELGVEYRRLPSGASHDTQMIQHVTQVGMIFVPSAAGISHSPEEWTDPGQIATGVQVLGHTVLSLDAKVLAS